MRSPRISRYAALREFLAELHEPTYRLKQITDAIFRNGVRSYDAITVLPSRLRERLVLSYGKNIPRLVPIAHERGVQVEKVLFESSTGARIESVLSSYRTFTSLCVSSQVGCGLGCTFCATGAVGLVRNLTADEICDQVLHFTRPDRPVDSVSFMGMGEALANPHTFEALEVLTDKGLFNLSPRRLTVSTVGFAPGLRRLVDEHPRVTITLSVHSPYEEERARLIPLQHRFPLRQSLDILEEHAALTGRKAYLAYLLIKDLNDDEEHAEALASLIENRKLLHVSVIPYNDAIGVTEEFSRPTEARTQRFLQTLRKNGIHATRRQQFGDDLEAACGQLHAKYLER